MSINGMSVQDKIRVFEAGASFDVSAQGTSVLDLARLAAAAKKGGGQLTVVDGQGLSVSDLIKISSAAPGKVFFTN
ncbi:hypothetical protein P3C22_14690 [Pseudomonas sp. ER28]|uniref:hypothetical protein n=1 Tax=Pseudomonas sp. ER28 TaxID=3033801 RepID=UPI0023DF93DC|nr:hypothetical protein [Pseudomonas sp. ER28]EKT4454393.1 hypothetical protein [Pseudomonas putida]EKT4511208.1 hypothetical protein [Pseudomonas putida]MDF3173281.1 hypothetical protein [Pseudomonas sp. ER28]